MTFLLCAGRGAQAACDNTIVFIPDNQLTYELRTAAGVAGAVVLASDLCGLTTLDLQEEYIKDLRGLEYCVDLETLKLGKNAIVDLAPLAGLTKLKTLELFETQVADLSPLAGLTNLESLTVTNSNVSDLSPLAGLTKLNRLECGSTNVASLAPLSGLSALTYLNASVCPITDASPLAGLPLTNVDFGGCPLTSLSGVASIPSISRVRISYTKITDLSALVSNAAFATNDQLEVYTAPLSPTARCSQLATLEARGVYISTNEDCHISADNNDCANAVEVTLGRTYGGDSTGATGTDITNCGNADGKDVWFKVTPKASFNLTASTEGSTLDTTLAVFTGCGTGQVVCNDDVIGGTTWSRVNWTAQAGATYWLRIAGYNSQAGRYQIRVSLASCGSADEVDIPDPGLEQVLREALLKPSGPLLSSELCTIEELNFYGQTVGDLTGLEQCTNLAKLTLVSFVDTDFSPVGGLTRLREFSAYYIDGMTSLDYLANCTELNKVIVYDTDLATLDGLENMTLLESLSVTLSPLQDITGIESATGLQYLTLKDGYIADITPISNCVQLREVNLSNNLIVDPSPLSGLPEVTNITLYANALTSLNGLQSLPKLDKLNVAQNALTSIPAFVDMPLLKELYVGSNEISSLASLAGSPSLETVYAEETLLDNSALNVFYNLPNISKVSLARTQITGVGPFVNMASFATGDALYVSGAPLTAATICNDLQVIRDRGATVSADTATCPPPASEDKCSDAYYIYPGSSRYASLTGAGGTDVSSCGENLDIADVWYWYTSPTPRTLTISTCGSDFDTTLAIFDACGGTQIACADDNCDDQEEITFDAVVGQKYYFRISGFGGDTGFYRIALDAAPCGTGIEVEFPDPKLETKVRAYLGRSLGPIYDRDLCGITNFSLYNTDVTDLTGLRYFTALPEAKIEYNFALSDISELENMPWLTNVDISGTAVSSLAPLRNLPNLNWINLSYSDVTELAPLLENPGIDTGASVSVNGAPLSANAVCNTIPALQARGVNVYGASACMAADAIDECATTNLILEEDWPVAGVFTGATGTDESSCTEADTSDVWYLYFSLDSAPAYFMLCDSDPGVTLTVYDGCGGAELLCAESQDVCGKSLPALSAAPGTLMLVRLSAAEGGAEQYGLMVSKNTEIGLGLPYGHAADINGDDLISLSELLRTIQFFNSGSFGCQVGTEDGYSPSGPNQSCTPHSADYNPQDWAISLNELLRMIQFFNSGGYHPCPAGEDGYCPGPVL
jgi:Leucine-rich repeat (LRR) protein